MAQAISSYKHPLLLFFSHSYTLNVLVFGLSISFFFFVAQYGARSVRFPVSVHVVAIEMLPRTRAFAGPPALGRRIGDFCPEFDSEPRSAPQDYRTKAQTSLSKPRSWRIVRIPSLSIQSMASVAVNRPLFPEPNDSHALMMCSSGS